MMNRTTTKTADTSCDVVKMVGNDVVSVPVAGCSYDDAVSWIAGKRYYGMYAVRDRVTGRLLSMSFIPTWTRSKPAAPASPAGMLDPASCAVFGHSYHDVTGDCHYCGAH